MLHRGHLPNGALASVSLDRAAIPQAVLDIRHKTRSNPLVWRGQFSPQLVEALLAFHAPAGRQLSVFDPFVGSGTVLFEAARRKDRATGTEVNPAAFYLSSFYRLAELAPAARAAALRAGEAALAGLLASAGSPLDRNRSEEGEDLAGRLTRAWTSASASDPPPGALELLSALVVLVDLDKRPVTRARVTKTFERLAELAASLPRVPAGSIEVLLRDARQTGLASASVDLVTTSPPYINVFNYHQKYRASVEALGWDVLSAARSEIGANRKHRANRLLTVIQYCLDMSEVLSECSRLLRPEGVAVFVVGRESMVRKTAFYNGEILAELARGLGMELRLRQERVFGNRFGQQIFEDVLHLSPGAASSGRSARSYDHARRVARQVLTSALATCPEESRADVEAALGRLAEVVPSPLAGEHHPSEGLTPAK